MGHFFEGQEVLNESTLSNILDLLKKDIVHKAPFSHSYPYDWRTNQVGCIHKNNYFFTKIVIFHIFAAHNYSLLKTVVHKYVRDWKELRHSYWLRPFKGTFGRFQ